MTRRVCALIEAGSAFGRNPLLRLLADRLARRGVELSTWDPTQAFDIPPRPPEAELYLLKGDHPAVLSAAGCVADSGTSCLNTYDATAAAADKARSLARLARAGLPVPATVVVSSADELRELLAGATCVVKPIRGAHGEGVKLLGPGRHGEAGPGPWLVQEAILGPGYEFKVYGVGERVAVRRARVVPGAVDYPRVPVDRPDSSLVRGAQSAARAAQLVCYGADFLVGPQGLVLIDLNAFPGYRGVHAAGEWVAEAVMEHLQGAG